MRLPPICTECGEETKIVATGVSSNIFSCENWKCKKRLKRIVIHKSKAPTKEGEKS